MDDPVRLSEQHFRTIYERGFYTWAELHGTAINNPGLSFLDLRDTFPKQPCFPQQLRLKKVTNENRVYASGYSTWGSSVIRCEHGTPSFRQQVQVEVAAKTVITLTTKTLSADFTQEWFPGNRNYIAVLALAWTYVLSARWAEMFPGICSLTYCRESVCEDLNEQSTVVVDIGDASADEAQWWASILTQGQGWCATMTFGHETFVSPWSIRLESNHKFVLSTKAPSAVPPFPPAPSFSSANRFLTRFCLRHGIADQSRAALAAVLLFPGIGRGRTLQLPVSPGSDQKMSTQTSSHPNFNYNSYQLVRDSDLDRLLTLSCFTRGLRPMLLSVFYEPSIECNAVSAWLQGSLAAIHERARHAPLVLGRMLMDRSPKISFLWLGVTVLGLQEDFLAEVRRGHIPIDLHSAAWSGTTQTFLQLPTSNCHDGYVTRADECRLLFLSQSDRHTRLPLVQWKPFGSTLLEDTDLEVRNHARCDSHKLYYQGFEWDVHKVGPFGSTPLEDTDLEVRNHARCDSHKLYYQVFEWEVHKVGLFFLIHTLLRHSFSLLSRLLIKIQRTARLVSPPWWRPHKDAVSYDEMDLQREVISENATRNIFTWLRPDGCARHENEIWDHEWFGDWESEDEFEESGQSDRAKHDALSRVDAWLKSFAKE